MKPGVALVALLSWWRRTPLQLAMLLLGLALATALWSGVQAINAEARASYARAAQMLGQGDLTRLVDPTGGRISQQVFAELRAAGWAVSPILEGHLRLGDQRFRLIGVDPPSLPPEAGFGEFPTGGAAMLMAMAPPEVLFGAPDTLGQVPPDLEVPLGLELREAPALAPGVLVADIRIARQLLGAPGEISYFLLAPEQPEGRAPLDEAAPRLREAAPEGGAELARLTDSFHLNLTAFGLLAFAVGLFIVHAAIGLAFEQRRSMFRTLRALGLTAGALIALLMAELLVLALVAGVVGVALGYVIAAALMPDVAATLSGLYGATLPGTLALRPEWWLSGMAIALLGTLAAGARGLWRIYRLPLLAPAQPRAWARASERALMAQGAVALALLALAVMLGVWGGGLVAGFAMLAAFLLAAALALPVVLSGALALAARRVRGVMGEWFLADTRQQLPGLSLALMALMLALAANIGVSTMVSSFRLTFTGWLDQRLAAELYVTARSEAEAEDLRAWLAPRADAVLPVWRFDTDVAGEPTTLYGVADHATYRDHWPLLQTLPEAWDAVAAGEAVMINEQLSRRAGLRPGDAVELPGGWRGQVAGVYSDYGNPTGQVMLGIDDFLALYPEVPRREHAVRVAPERAADLARDLQDTFSLPDQNVTDQAEAKAASLRIFERTFAVTGALNLLTLGVATVALLASLVTLSGMRLPQLAPVWAMGLTRARLAQLELARMLMLAALTAIAALPVGLGLAWVLLAVINVDAFGWRLPMHLFPADWLRLGLMALLAAGLAAAWPVRRLARMAPGDLLRVFASER
ncbi:ABC transporter permease [Alkalilacustris brevis]|uniref:ABC transporter permease n=1 Tax=Alkalilacustris brevis TaxID=2026338 RepID=UPI000E0CC85A|nr:FtsX-like permease family protein [Alkalilacustris brevis]